MNLSSSLISLFLFPFALSQSLAAWNNGVGDQVVYQNTSGDLLSSLQTGNGIGEGGFTEWNKLPLSMPTKAGSKLAGTGYTTGGGSAFAQVVYISTGGSIVQADFECLLSSGNCTLQSSNIISGAVSSGVDSSTALAATLRSEDDGYRILYHNAAGAACQLRYTPNVTWGQEKYVMTENNESLASLATDGSANMTAYGINAAGDIMTSSLQKNGTWAEGSSISSQSFPSWDPSNVTLAATSDNTTSKSLYYIGTDHVLHGVSTSDNWKTTNLVAEQSSVNFPSADEPNAIYAASSSSDSLRFYYISTGGLVQATLNDGAWQNAVLVFGNSTSTASETTTESHNSVKIGVGVGLGLGLPVLIAAGVVVYMLLKRRKRPSAQELAGSQPPPQLVYQQPPTPGPPVPEKSPCRILKMSVEYYELGHDDKCHELAGSHASWSPGDKKNAADFV